MTETEAKPGAQVPADRRADDSVMAPARQSDGAPAEDWRRALPDDLRRVAEKFAAPEDVVKSYAALERRLGRSIAIPGEGASAAEIDAFYARLGRPATPDGYRVAHAGSGDAGADARLGGFLAAVHAAGASQSTVQAALDWYGAARAEATAEAASRQAERRAEAERALRRDWGAGYDRRLALAQRAVRQFGGADFVATLAGGGLADHPSCLRAFAEIGEALAEDSLIDADAGGGAPGAQSRIDAIMAEHFGRPSYSSPAVQGELRRLYETLYGAPPSDPLRGERA